MYAGGIRAVLRRAVYWLSLCLCLLEPFAGYKVYYVEYPQLVRPGRLFEVRVNLLDENRFGLRRARLARASRATQSRSVAYLDVGDAQRRQASDTRPGHSRRFEVKHGLEAGLQVGHRRCHDAKATDRTRQIKMSRQALDRRLQSALLSL